MTAERKTHRLTCCAPVPLARYLKALGILRIVAEQERGDPTVQGWWSGDIFHLRTSLDRESLREFFLNRYQPTPVVAPWNGGSGFYPKDNRTAITALTDGHAKRLSVYREAIAACRSVCSQLQLSEKPDGDQKALLLMACRGQLPDEAIAWLDAAFVLTDGGPKYPPLLGTGGNDGRLEFTNNLMQRLLDLIDPESGAPTGAAASWWDDAFFSHVQNDLQRDSILGQFDPGALDRPVNPWDYVLMIEGALVFAAAATKRLESATKGTLSYPFSVRSAGVGYGSAAAADEDSSRSEIWLPLWSSASSFPEIEALFSEGRAQVNGRTAKNGIDFARAVSSLGTDRGITQFARYGFQARNGLAYFAVPLGRFKAEPQPQVNLLADPELDDWLDRFRRAASSDTAPAAAGRALRRLESAILDLCQHGKPRLQDVLIALGETERVLALSGKWRAEAYLKPVPLLPPQWLVDSNDDSPEFRLALSLAGIYSRNVGSLRQHLEPVEIINGRWPSWTEDSAAERNVVWNRGDLEDNLIAVLQRRSIEGVRTNERAPDDTLVFPGDSCCYASLDDIARFIGYDTDDHRISALVRGLVLLDWKSIRNEQLQRDRPELTGERMPDATYAVLKLCHAPYHIKHGVTERYVRLEPAIARLAAAGRISEAVQLAVRRLIGSNLPPAIRTATRNGTTARRLSAALLFPVNRLDLQQLADSILTPESSVR